MVEAVRTTASPAAIWAIVVVATGVLAFWLSAVMLADRSQARASGRARAPGETELGSRGQWAAGSVPGGLAAEVPEAAGEPVAAPGGPSWTGQAAERSAQTRAEVPAQRTGDADRAGRSHAGPAAPGPETGR